MLQADVLSSQSLMQTLRTLSLKGRQGVLEIRANSVTLEATLFDGKIVAVKRTDEVPTMEVCSKLAKAGLLTVEVLQQVADVELSFDELFGYLVRMDPQVAEAFLRAKHAYELDLLHSLSHLQDGALSFIPKVVKVSEEFASSIFPGQLLLDLVELSGEEQRFADFLGEAGSDDEVRVYRTGLPKHRLLPHEEVVWQLLGREHEVDALEKASLLSHYHFLQAMMSFIDQGLLSLGASDLEPIEELGESDDDSLFGESKEELEEYLDLDLREVSESIAEEPRDQVTPKRVSSLSSSTQPQDSSVFEPVAIAAEEKSDLSDPSTDSRRQAIMLTIGVFLLSVFVIVPISLGTLLLAIEKLASLN